MSDKYVIRNCPAILKMTKICDAYETTRDLPQLCKDRTDCVLKQIVEKCREVNTKFYDSVHQRYLSPSKAKFARQILELLDIEEIE